VVAEVKILELAHQILEYVLSNPDAADSIEGVASSWLGSRSATRREVEEALDLLVAEGKVQATESPRGIVFRSVKGHRPPR
jgi:hypothetical protein